MAFHPSFILIFNRSTRAQRDRLNSANKPMQAIAEAVTKEAAVDALGKIALGEKVTAELTAWARERGSQTT